MSDDDRPVHSGFVADPSSLPADVQIKPLDAPVFYGNDIRLIQSGNDFTVMIGRPRPGIVAGQPSQQIAVGAEIVAILQFSPQTFKDLMLLCSDAVAVYENEYGEIKTKFIMDRAQAKT